MAGGRGEGVKVSKAAGEEGDGGQTQPESGWEELYTRRMIGGGVEERTKTEVGATHPTSLPRYM